MRKHRIALVVLTVLQIAVSAFLLNTLSRINGWSAVYGEDSEGYLLTGHYFAGRPIGEADVPLLRYRLFNPVVPAWRRSGPIVGIRRDSRRDVRCDRTVCV